MAFKAIGHDMERGRRFFVFNITDRDIKKLKQGAILVVETKELGLDTDIHVCVGEDDDVHERLKPSILDDAERVQ